MAIYRGLSGLKQMGEAMERRLVRNKGTQEEVFAEIVDRSYVDHILLMGGHLSPAQTHEAFARGATAALSNPKAGRRLLSARQIKIRKLKRGGAPLLPINVQTGYLLHQLKKTGPKGPDQVYQITNAAPYAAFILGPNGTKKMVARGFSQEIGKRFKLYLSSYARVLRARLK